MINAKFVSALALSALAATAQAAPVEPAALTLPTSVWFDGFCDGIVDIVKVGRQGYAGTYDASTNCGEFSAQSGGPIGRNMAKAGVLTQGAAFTIETYPYYGVTVTIVVNADGTFGVFDSAGNTYTFGTWTAGASARQSAGPRGAAKATAR